MNLIDARTYVMDGSRVNGIRLFSVKEQQEISTDKNKERKKYKVLCTSLQRM